MTTDQLAPRRILAARKCMAWTEIDADRLVRRERFLVDTETDEVFRRYPGDAFSPSAEIVADQALTFYVSGGDVFVLERAGA